MAKVETKVPVTTETKPSAADDADADVASV